MATNKLCIFKASPLGEKAVPDMEIKIRTQMPETKTLDETFSIFQCDAELIADALFASLPQGTLDRLTAELIGRTARRMGYMGKSS